jgi:hypothetical protein
VKKFKNIDTEGEEKKENGGKGEVEIKVYESEE